MGAFRTVSYGVGGVFYCLVSSLKSQVSYQLIWKLTLLLLCLLSTTTTTSATARKERGFDIVCNLTTIDGVIHDIVSRQSFGWFLLNLVDVDLHSVIFCLSRIRETNRSSQISDLVELVKDILS
jgi:inner membrane protein involved in colicin E2 resistance